MTSTDLRATDLRATDLRGAHLRSTAPGWLLAAAASACAGLSTAHLGWALPAALAALLAGRRPGPVLPAVVALAVPVTAGVVMVLVLPDWTVPATRLTAVLVTACMLPWLVGRFWLQYRELARLGWERAAQLEREQRLAAEQARLRERARIAQDMHDVLGHDLSLIALSAGALKLAPGLAEEHRAAAGEIRARAAASVERLGEVIGVLRADGDRAPREPGGRSVGTLVAEAVAAGLDAGLTVEGSDEGVDEAPAAVARAVERVVQEGLTNAARHAPGAPVAVRLRYADRQVVVEVVNGPATQGRSVPAGGGHGLAGLDERVRLAGGVLTHGPDGAGGHRLHARLPYTGEPRPAPVAGDGPPEHHRARRRVRRALVAAVLLPLFTGGVLTAGLVGWETLSASGAVLAAEDWAKIETGQRRAELAPLLPERQTVHRPRAVAPEGEGIECEYYAVTADRFDDRSGDAYRLCFRDGRLVVRDLLTP
ncbi:sensor histidine kinase [Kitasatospora sp. NPDC051853]|uniref:sensor histidine kinase n=1 Tax=Kitasatospora sp. NPDC051853 TaxID=3364058 RepID=UPI00378E8504